MHPILFQFRSITIYTYGFFVALAVLAAYFFAGMRAKQMKLDPSLAMDLVFYLFVSGVVGARLFYVIQHFEDYQGHLLRAISIPEGGLVWYGGFIVAALTGLALAAWNKWPFLKLCDLLAPILPLAHAIGRVGCFFNGCCYGRQTSSFLGVRLPGDDVARLPVQLFESTALFLLSIGLLRLSEKKRVDGQLFVIYLLFYSVFRFLIEFLRGDQKPISSLTEPQWTSILLFLGAVFLLAVINKKRKT